MFSCSAAVNGQLSTVNAVANMNVMMYCAPLQVHEKSCDRLGGSMTSFGLGRALEAMHNGRSVCSHPSQSRREACISRGWKTMGGGVRYEALYSTLKGRILG